VRDLIRSISGAPPRATPSNDPLQLPPGVTSVILGTVGSLLTFVGNLTVVYFLCFFLGGPRAARCPQRGGMGYCGWRLQRPSPVRDLNSASVMGPGCDLVS